MPLAESISRLIMMPSLMNSSMRHIDYAIYRLADILLMISPFATFTGRRALPAQKLRYVRKSITRRHFILDLKE